MKKIFIVISIIILSISLNAQDFDITKQFTYGGTADEYSCTITECSQGGYFIGITSFSGASGNKTTGNFGNNDMWIVKTDEELNIEWQKSYGGLQADWVVKVLQDAENNLYMCGYVSTSDGGNITVDIDGIDYFVTKLDSDGNEIWQKSYIASNMDFCMNALIHNDRLFLFGNSNSEISHDKTDFCRGSDDYWVVCIDTAGNKLWDKTYGGTSVETMQDAAYDKENNVIYVAGRSMSNVGYEKSQDAYNGYYDMWVLKINAIDGELIWDKTIGSNAAEQNISIALSDSYLYCATSNSGEASGDKTEDSYGGDDYWIVKIDQDGNVVWDKTIGGTGDDHTSDISILSNNQIIISGNSNSPISSDKTEEPLYSSLVGGELVYIDDFWYVCINENGNVIWDKTIGGFGYDYYAKTIIDVDNNSIISAGVSTSEISGNKTSPHFGGGDIWVIEMTLPALGVNMIEQNNCNIYPNPAIETVFISYDKNISILNIYDLTGRLMFQTKNCNEIKVNLDNFSSGLYLIEIESEGNRITQKLVVE